VATSKSLETILQHIHEFTNSLHMRSDYALLAMKRRLPRQQHGLDTSTAECFKNMH
jgi:hypothetical protein